MPRLRGSECNWTENESSFQIWLICCPEMAGILDEFEKTLSKTSNEVQEHHNSTISAQSSFQRVLKLHLSVIG